MPRPNFFITGAPKSGTTALSAYLREHPAVHIPRHKEPNYWNDDFNLAAVDSLAAYEALFQEAGPAHTAVGEATVHYLRSERAVPRILAYDPAARFIALLRNPVEIAHAWHSQMIYGLYEDESDFERAWDLQGERAQGRQVPKLCPEPKVLVYREVAAVGSHVERLMETAPKAQVRLYLFDDFRRDPGMIYRDVLSFLDVADDGRTTFPVINENKRQRNSLIARLVERPPRIWTTGAALARKALGRSSIGLMQRLRAANQEAVARAPLSPAMRQRLNETFEPEVELLGKLLDRDLSRWFETPAEVVANAGPPLTT